MNKKMEDFGKDGVDGCCNCGILQQEIKKQNAVIDRLLGSLRWVAHQKA